MSFGQSLLEAQQLLGPELTSTRVANFDGPNPPVQVALGLNRAGYANLLMPLTE